MPELSNIRTLRVLGRVRRYAREYFAGAKNPSFVIDPVREYYRASFDTVPFDAALTFTRTGAATYVDATGTLQTAADGEPRIGHHIWDGSNWVNEGLLLESESRTNLLLSSGDFSGGNWSFSGSGNPTRTVVNGEQRVSWTSGAGNVLDNKSGPAPSAGETYTLSFRVKVIDLDGANLSSNFLLSLEDGDRTEGADNVPVTLVDNGEYLVVSVTHTFSAPSGTSIYTHFRYGGGNSPVLAIEYGQLEEGPTPSSYIPTSGSTVTRAAETLTAPAANLPYPELQFISSELVTNGTFDTDTSGWNTLNATLSHQTDRARVTADAGGFSSGQYTLSGLTPGDILRITVEITAQTGNYAVRVYTTGFSGFVGTFVANLGFGVGVHSGNVRVPDGISDMSIHVSASPALAGEYVEFDNVSVKKIKPLSLSIAMEGLETFADLDAAGQVTLYDWRVNANNRITLTLDTDSTKVGTLTLTMVNGGSTATISTTAELTPGINDPFNVAIVATSNELGIALDGTAETRVSHTIGLPDLSAEDATMEGMGTRALVRAWGEDIGDSGIEEASS